jgi:4-hydroxy-4-methyl-2-oxoglutarate aldolase
VASHDRFDDLARRCAKLYTGALTDVLDERGYLNQTLPPEILPLREGMRLAGPAWTVEGHQRARADFDTSMRATLTMLGEVPKDHVIIYQTNDRVASHLGELSVIALKQRGCRGAVIDGGTRDVEYILREDFPVFTRYKTPQDSVPRWSVTAWGQAVTIGDVRVSSGDFVVADLDGIVVIPQQLVESVVEEAERVVGVENSVRAAVRDGMLPLDAYEQFGAF